MIRKSYFGVFQTLLMFMTAISVSAHAHNDKAEAAAKAACEKEIEPLFKFNVEMPGTFTGFMPGGLTRMQEAQKALQETSANYNKVFESMGNILSVDFQAMATKNNVFHLGGPGGAKTGHLLWLLREPIPESKGGGFVEPWHIQMHEWRTDADIFGAVIKAALEKGLIHRNTENSIVRAKFGIIDEATASTPAVFGALLSFLNPKERFYTNDEGKRAVAETRSVFLTGNATRHQMLRALWERLITTGPALLNRTIYKTWVPNWLAESEQERADEIERKMVHWDSAIEIGTPEQRKRAQELKRQHSTSAIDWQVLQHFALQGFVSSPELIKATQALANSFRIVLAKAIFQSFTDNATDPRNHPFILVPTAQMTERLRRVFEIAIRTSAMLDYVEMVGWDKIEAMKNPIVLKPSSLWRLSYILTTIGNGVNILDQSGPDIKVNFGMIRHVDQSLKMPPDRKILEEGLGDPVEREEYKNMLLEQDWFNVEFKKLVKPNPNDATDIENAISKHKMARGY